MTKRPEPVNIVSDYIDPDAPEGWVINDSDGDPDYVAVEGTGPNGEAVVISVSRYSRYYNVSLDVDGEMVSITQTTWPGDVVSRLAEGWQEEMAEEAV